MDRWIAFLPAVLALFLVLAVTGFVPAPQFSGFDATEFTFVGGSGFSRNARDVFACAQMCGGTANTNCKGFIFCNTTLPNNPNNCFYSQGTFMPSNRQTWDCTTYYRPSPPPYAKKFSASVDYKYLYQVIDAASGVDQTKNFLPMVQQASYRVHDDDDTGDLMFDGTVSVAGCTKQGDTTVCPSAIKPGKNRAQVSNQNAEVIFITENATQLNCIAVDMAGGSSSISDANVRRYLREMLFIANALDLRYFQKPDDFQYAWDREPKIRGIPVNTFIKQITTVGTIDNIKSGTTIMHFSKPSFHGEPGDSRSQFEIPVRVITAGVIPTTLSNGAVVDYEFVQIADFFDFEVKAAFDMETFETPRGVLCPNRKIKKDFPPLPSVFSARYSTTTDILFQGASGVMNSDAAVWHDMEHNIYRRDMRTPIPQPPFKTLHKTSFIHDFNAGMVYVLDMEWGNCSLGVISNSSGEDVAPPTDDSDGQSTMVTSELLFHLNNRDYSYEGVRLIDDVKTDVWIGRVENYVIPGLPPSPAVLEYFFPADNALYFSNGKNMPMYYEINVFAGDTTAFTKTHLYDVRKSVPNLDVFSIVRRCFRSADLLILEVTLAADHVDDTQDILQYRVEFELAFRNKLAAIGGVSVLRFQRFRYFLLPTGEVEVMLYMQETVPKRYHEFWPYMKKSNEELRDTLIEAAKKTFDIAVGHNHPDKFPGSNMPRHSVTYKVNKVVEADLSQYGPPAASTQKTERKGGVSSGAAAGIAITMLLVGAGIVAVIMLVVVRKRGVDALPFVQFDNKA